MDLTNLLPDLLPLLWDAMAVILAWVISMAALAVKARFGIDIEERHRRALHEALMSGAKAAIAEGPGAGAEALVDKAIQHARESVPDAFGALSPALPVLQRLARGKIDDVLHRLAN